MSVQHANPWIPYPIHLPQAVDIVIVGGGITGITLLHRLKQVMPEIKMVLLEEAPFGYHSSGRNLGYIQSIDNLKIKCLDDYWSIIKKYTYRLYDLIAREKIDCDLQFSGGLHLGTTLTEIDAIEKSKLDLTELMSEGELRTFLGTQRFKRGLFVPFEGTLHPYKFLLGLAQLVSQHIMLGACVDEVSHETDKIVVHVKNRGHIVTKNIVYCTGAYTPTLLPLSQISCQRQYCFVTKPLPDSLVGKMPSLVFKHRDRIIRVCNNVLFISGQSELVSRPDDSVIVQSQFDKLRYAVNSIYPGLTKRFGIDRTWSIVNAVTKDSLPIVGAIKNFPGHYINVGHGMHGFASSLCGADVIVENLFTPEKLTQTAQLFSPDRFEEK